MLYNKFIYNTYLAQLYIIVLIKKSCCKIHWKHFITYHTKNHPNFTVESFPKLLMANLFLNQKLMLFNIVKCSSNK